NLRLETTRTLDVQRQSRAVLRKSAKTAFAAGAMGAVGGAVGVEEISPIAVCVAGIVTAAKIIRPDIGGLCSYRDGIQVHVREKICPIIRRLSDQRAACA